MRGLTGGLTTDCTRPAAPPAASQCSTSYSSHVQCHLRRQRGSRQLQAGAHSRRPRLPAVACVAGSAHPAARPAAHRPQQEQQQQEPQPAQDTPEVKQGWFEWNKYGPCRINYYQAGSSGPPLLLVHGFGVGAYHFERNLHQLSSNHRVWAVDLMGQGCSFPDADPPADGPVLRYSIDTWTEQLLEFVQQVVGEPAFVAGNSLGGFLAVSLAANHPEAVRGLALLNATPFWSFRPRDEQAGGVWRLIPGDGAVPVAEAIKRPIERLWWNNLRSAETIRSMLQLVYADKSALDQRLVERIVEATEHPRALDAFTSIVLSPKSALTFDQMLEKLRCPVLMLYGRQDPWVVPLWGQRLKRWLGDRAAYLELEPVGHCPHHEAPRAVNCALGMWLGALEAGGDASSWSASEFELRIGESFTVEEAGGTEVTVTHIQGAARNVFERLDAALWRLQQVLRRAPPAGQGGSGDGSGSGAPSGGGAPSAGS